MNNIQGNAEIVPIEFLSPNPWNYNQQDDLMFEKQKNSLEHFSLSAPIIVREVASSSSSLSVDTSSSESLSAAAPTERRYEIVDGEHRYRAALELGYTEVAVWNLGDIPDTQAQQLTILMNEIKGTPRIDDLGILMKSLDEQIGRDVLEMNMPFSAQQIEDLISTVEFDWSNFEADIADEGEAKEKKPNMLRIEFLFQEKQFEVIDRAIKTYCFKAGLDSGLEEDRAVALSQISVQYLESV